MLSSTDAASVDAHEVPDESDSEVVMCTMYPSYIYGHARSTIYAYLRGVHVYRYDVCTHTDV